MTIQTRSRFTGCLVHGLVILALSGSVSRGWAAGPVRGQLSDSDRVILWEWVRRELEISEDYLERLTRGEQDLEPEYEKAILTAKQQHADRFGITVEWLNELLQTRERARPDQEELARSRAAAKLALATGLLIGNFPTYMFISWIMYDSWRFWQFGRELIRWRRESGADHDWYRLSWFRQWLELKNGLFVLLCVGVVVAQFLAISVALAG